MAVGDRTTLNQLFEALRDMLAGCGVPYGKAPVYRDFRAGDVRHSQANVDKARDLLGYQPMHDIRAGLRGAMPWYVESLQQA